MLLIGADTSSRQLINQAQAFPSSASDHGPKVTVQNSGKEIWYGVQSHVHIGRPSRPAQPSLVYTFPIDNGDSAALFNLESSKIPGPSKEQL